MTAGESSETRDRETAWPRPSWQSARHSKYALVEQPTQRVRQPDPFVPPEIRYWAEL
jgi:hypothetical protein